MKDGRPMWSGRACTSLDELARTVNWARGIPSADVYICMSSQARSEPKVSKTNKPYVSAIRFKDNAVALSSLFIDVDVKEDAYKTHEEALAAIQNFIAFSGLPMPTAVVETGSGGMHCHWATTQPMTPAQWRPLSFAMVRAVRESGLISDTQCTIDAARILRIPGTSNYKTGTPRPVKLLSLGEQYELTDLEAVLARFQDDGSSIPQDGWSLPRRPVTQEGNELTAGISTGHDPIDIENVAQNCPFIFDTLKNGGKDWPNPLWFLTVGLAGHCIDPRPTAHRLSSGHPGYDPAATDALFDRLYQNGTGWTSCQTVEGTGYKGCQACPKRGMGKSPLHFSYVAPAPNPNHAAAAQDPSATLPPGFSYDSDGYVFHKSFDNEGKPIVVPILNYPMMDAWLQDNPWCLHFETKIHGNRRIKIEAPLAELAPKDGVGKVFGRQGMLLRDKVAPLVREFLVSWVKQLQDSKNSVVSSTPFGWSTHHGKIEGFTYAGKIWSADGDRPSSTTNENLQAQYQPKGHLDAWAAAAEIITHQQRPQLDAIIASSFGGPLVRFTGQTGVMLSAYSSESGIGKTTVMRVAQAVWGDPVKAMNTLTDTANSVLNKIGTLKALPIFWDELKGEQGTDRFVQLCFQLTQGKEKSRLNSDVTQRDPGTWQTMLVTASNDSLIDPVIKATKSTTAGLYRLFEYPVPPGQHGQIEHGVVSRTVAQLNDNFGQAGLLYAQFLGANHERIAKEVAAVQDALSEGLKAGNDERFWFATMTVVLMGAKYSNELGLTRIDIKALRVFLCGVLAAMRAEVVSTPADMKNTMSVSNILAQFLNAMRTKHTLFTNQIHMLPGKPATGVINIQCDASRLDGIFVQVGNQDRQMRISSTQLSKWLHDNEQPRHAFTKALKEEFGARIINGKLGSGTDRVCGMEYLLHLDLNNPKLAGFIE